MNIEELKRVLRAFADDPADVDIRRGKLVAQIHDEIIEVSLEYEQGAEQNLVVIENEQRFSARSWLISRIARLPQLADRILAITKQTNDPNASSSFVTPSGLLSPDLSAPEESFKDTPITNIVETLLGTATRPVPGATSVLYVTSDAGEGKTTILNRVAQIQAQRYKEKKSTSLIVPIPLGGRSFLTFDDAVIAALVNKLRFNYLYFDAFLELVRLGAIVPAFDGYEEMLVESSKNEAVSALGSLIQSLGSSGTILIAARKAFFEYLSFRTQAKLLDAIGDRSVAFSRLGISRWSREQFCEYGCLRGIEQPEQIYDAVSARLGSDHPILTRAVLVRRLFDVAAEQSERAELVELLGSAPHDYFYTFVDAIVKREALEKWLSRVSGEVRQPLLTSHEHHELLSYIAQEMWQTSSASLRYDVVDVLVELFAETQGKAPSVVRQIKERLKQHSLLVADSGKTSALAFDHEDFQNFYLGEAFGRLLTQANRADLYTFISVNLLPKATIEQSIQHLLRVKGNVQRSLQVILEINSSEPAFSFCKENCGALAVRLAECLQDDENDILLNGMFFSGDILSGRNLHNIKFKNCHFLPTSFSASQFDEVMFLECEFERLEVNDGPLELKGCSFINCRIDSLVNGNTETYLFAPDEILALLINLGASINSQNSESLENASTLPDERIRIVERFLRIFLRNTNVDEDVIRLRLGRATSPRFFDEILPSLSACGILEEVPWTGRGVQRRYKLRIPLSDVSNALEAAGNSFEEFISTLKTSSF
jgi:VIT1/CCC1 family predicted Fe2+/Mn2+ transporter